MSSAGQRGKKRQLSDPLQNEQKDRPWNPQPDLRGYEQGDLQGGGGSSVKPALKRDGASRNITGRRSLGHTPISRNTASRYNIGSSRNTTMTNSYNIVDNSRAYDHAKHNEFTHSEFYGHASFGDTYIHNTPQPGPPMDIRMHEVLQKLVQTIGWDILSGKLSVIDQDAYLSTISPFNRNNPENFWISKNIDFMQWELANDSRALLLSAPPGHGTTEVCSHVIDLAQRKASQTNSCVLYFFSSTAAKARRLTVFTHTLLRQIVCCSSDQKANSIAVAFLSTLKILDFEDNELITPLMEAIKKQRFRVVDHRGWLAGEYCLLVDPAYCGTTPKSKVLLTSQSPFGMIPDGMRTSNTIRSQRSVFVFSNMTIHAPTIPKMVGIDNFQLLYIEGKPGSGKSTLAKYLKQNLIEREPNTRSSTVAHYFYTFRGTELERTHVNMLRSLLYCILQQDESSFFHFQQEFRNFRRNNLSEWPYDSLKRVLSSFANHPSTKPIYLILDAMDESRKTTDAVSYSYSAIFAQRKTIAT
ncbi:hypothetical protein BDD12DRAFT_876657 [Trichophaea hybrida]|nr:hypothetical protein BDD12DRAFT_876657 [Trichophaea hybrida]